LSHLLIRLALLVRRLAFGVQAFARCTLSRAHNIGKGTHWIGSQRQLFRPSAILIS
jgi:hypothetical protein